MRALTAVLLTTVVLFDCRSCVAVDQPLGFPCVPDAGSPEAECPAGLRCGLEGRCHLLDAGAEYLCRSSADCEGPYRCGLEGRCHLLDAGAEYQCHSSADCEGPYRCGLEGHCHPLDAGADYLCQGDPDCEAQWRCGPQGRCLDAARDALELPAGGFTTLAAAPLFGNLPTGSGPLGVSLALDLVRASDGGCTTDVQYRSYSWESGGQLTKHLAFSGAGLAPAPVAEGTGPACDALQRAAGPNTVELRAVTAPLVALVDQGPATVALSADGQLCRLAMAGDFSKGTPLDCRAPFGAARPTHLRGVVSSSDEVQPGYLAWTATQLWWLESFGAAARGPFSIAADGGTVVIGDALALPLANLETGLLVASSDAVWVARVTAQGVLTSPTGPVGSWEPQMTQFMTVYAQGSDRALAMKGGSLWVAGGQRGLVLTSTPSADSPEVFFGAGNPPFHRRIPGVTQTCAIDLDGGSKNLSLVPIDSSPLVGALTRCAPRDPSRASQGVFLEVFDPATPSSPRTVGNLGDVDTSPPGSFWQSPTRFGGAHPATGAWADQVGHLWAPEQASVVALFPDRPLAFVGGDSSRLRVGVSAVDWLPGLSGGLGSAFLSHNAWAVESDGGFAEGLRLGGADGTIGAVRGLPSAQLVRLPAGVFARDVMLTNGTLSAVRAAVDDLDAVRAPLDISVVTSPGGTQDLLWRSFDTVWLAALGPDVVGDGGSLGSALNAQLVAAPVPHRRLTPLVGQAITSLAFTHEVRPDGGTDYLDGYLVAGPRLFSFAAPNSRVWRSDEVVVGLDEPVDVFYDRSRARVGLRDGSLFSLPTRVLVAPPLDSSEGLARNFASVCQNVVVLSQQHLLRLSFAAGDQVGRWQVVPLPAEVAASASAPSVPFADSLLWGVDRDLVLVHGNGLSWRLSFEGCQ